MDGPLKYPISTFLSIKYIVNVISTKPNVSSPLIGCQLCQIMSWLGTELKTSCESLWHDKYNENNDFRHFVSLGYYYQDPELDYKFR